MERIKDEDYYRYKYIGHNERRELDIYATLEVIRNRLNEIIDSINKDEI